MTDQLSLLPDQPITPDEVLLELTALPEDDELLGDAPSTQLVASIKALGVLQPILLVRSDRTPSGYVVAAGRRRIKAARKAEQTHIPARIYPAGWTATEVLALVENQQRSRNPVADLHAIEQLLAQGASEQQICQATGLAKHELQARLRLKRLIPPLRSALDSGTLRVSVADAAAKLSPKRQAELMAPLEETGTLRHDDVDQVRRVQAVQAVATLPTDLFATPDAPSADWKVELPRLIARMRELVPEDKWVIRRGIDALEALLQADDVPPEQRDGHPLHPEGARPPPPAKRKRKPSPPASE